jgi:hypothetical protein
VKIKRALIMHALRPKALLNFDHMIIKPLMSARSDGKSANRFRRTCVCDEVACNNPANLIKPLEVVYDGNQGGCNYGYFNVHKEHGQSDTEGMYSAKVPRLSKLLT